MDILSIVEKPATQPEAETNGTSSNVTTSSNEIITPPQEGVASPSVTEDRASDQNALIDTVISARPDAAIATAPETSMTEQQQPASLPASRQLGRSSRARKSRAPPGSSAYPSKPKEATSFAHTITSLDGQDAPTQASKDCFARAGFHTDPASGNKAAWLPYLQALGLTKGVYPKIQVVGKAKQSGRIKKDNKPDWNFIIYSLLAVAPNGRLKLKQIFNICLAWCDTLGDNNASCRHNLCIKPEFVNFKDPLAKEKNDGGFWRLAKEDEGETTDNDEGQGTDSDPKTATTEAQGEVQSKKRKAKTPASANANQASTEAAADAGNAVWSQRTTAQNAPATPQEQSPSSTLGNLDSAYQSGNSPSPPLISQRSGRIRLPTLKRKEYEEQEKLEVESNPTREDERGDNGGPGPQTQASRKRQKTASQPKTKSRAKVSLDQSSTQTQYSNETQSSSETQGSNETQSNHLTPHYTKSGHSTHVHHRPTNCLPKTKTKTAPARQKARGKKADQISGWMDRHERDAKAEAAGFFRYYIPAGYDYGLPFSNVRGEFDVIDSVEGVVKGPLPDPGTEFWRPWIKPAVRG